MQISLLAAAVHAAATNNRFTVFFNPRASPSQFIVPLAKYVKAVYHTRVSVGLCFQLLFETEEFIVQRYIGTITGISDLDPVRWPNSHWRSVQVGWDESADGERQPTVSLWEIQPLLEGCSLQPSGFPSFPGRFIQPNPRGLGKRPNHSLLPFQQNQNLSCQQAARIQNQLLQQATSQQNLAPKSTYNSQPTTASSSALQDPRRSQKRPNHSLLPYQQNQSLSCHITAMIQSQVLQQVTSQQNLAPLPHNLSKSTYNLQQYTTPTTSDPIAEMRSIMLSMQKSQEAFFTQVKKEEQAKDATIEMLENQVTRLASSQVAKEGQAKDATIKLLVNQLIRLARSQAAKEVHAKDDIIEMTQLARSQAHAKDAAIKILENQETPLARSQAAKEGKAKDMLENQVTQVASSEDILPSQSHKPYESANAILLRSCTSYEGAKMPESDKVVGNTESEVIVENVIVKDISRKKAGGDIV